MSLKSSLTELIKNRNGETFTLKELEDFCHKAQYKLSNAERRLRQSESPNIEAVYDEKHHHIIGYRWKIIFDWIRNDFKKTKDRTKLSNSPNLIKARQKMSTLW